jgi:hypothetical protein
MNRNTKLPKRLEQIWWNVAIFIDRHTAWCWADLTCWVVWRDSGQLFQARGSGKRCQEEAKSKCGKYRTCYCRKLHYPPDNGER